jgi:hypothetical protein
MKRYPSVPKPRREEENDGQRHQQADTEEDRSLHRFLRTAFGLPNDANEARRSGVNASSGASVPFE